MLSSSHDAGCLYYLIGSISSLCLLLLLLLQAYLIYSGSVAAGAQSGIEECKYQFAWDRWNCPERALQLSTHSSLRSGESPETTSNNQARGLSFKWRTWLVGFKTCVCYKFPLESGATIFLLKTMTQKCLLIQVIYNPPGFSWWAQ